MAENEIINNDPQKIGETLLSWEADEFVQYDRGQNWYVGGAFLAILLIIYSIFTSNYLFTLIIAIMVAVIYLYAQKKPTRVKINLTSKGVMVNNVFYDYEDDLQNFWILYKPPDLKTLNLGRYGYWRSHVELQLENINPLKVREILLDYLDEDTEREENSIDRMSRSLKF